jgi:hypothetical protein
MKRRDSNSNGTVYSIYIKRGTLYHKVYQREYTNQIIAETVVKNLNKRDPSLKCFLVVSNSLLKNKKR